MKKYIQYLKFSLFVFLIIYLSAVWMNSISEGKFDLDIFSHGKYEVFFSSLLLSIVIALIYNFYKKIKKRNDKN